MKKQARRAKLEESKEAEKEGKKTDAVKTRMRRAREDAEQNGHTLDEWKWGNGYRRTNCQNRNCHAWAFVNPEGPGITPWGGNATTMTCVTRRYAAWRKT